MNAILKKITRLVDSEEDSIKCSAIRILGELEVKDRAVLKILGEKIAKETELVKVAILDSFIRNPQAGALAHLLPLLKTDGAVRRKVIHAIGAIGPKAIKLLEKEFKEASLNEKKIFIDIFSSLHSKPAIDFLVDSLLSGDLELLKYICFALKNQMDRMARPERFFLLKKVNSFLRLNQVKKNDEATTSGLILLGYVGEPATKRVLLKYLDKRYSFYVRRNALFSLTRLNLSGSGHEDLVEKLVPLLNDPDFPNVVRNALTILESVQIPRRFLNQFPKFLEARHPAVKRFVLTQLAHIPGQKTLKLLITHLDSPDPAVRDAAADSLGKLPRSVPDLLRKLEATKEVEKGERIALILRAHRSFFKGPKCRVIFKKLDRAIQKRDDQAKIYSLLLRQVNPDFFHASCLTKARQFKRKKNFEIAKRYLELLTTGLFYTDEVRYELASVLLKISKKDLTPPSRSEDSSLNFFTVLARSNYHNVVKLLKKDRVLDPNDLYYLGFHFAERLFEQKAFGIEVLKFLLKKYPRSKLAPAAKRKIALAGNGATSPVASELQAVTAARALAQAARS